MPYVIEEGIPVPAPQKGCGGNMKGPQTPWLRVVDSLKPGQSVLTECHVDYKAASQYANRNKSSRKYAIRKIPSQGWRVWRIE